jgi:Tfp pilus assembly protein PilF
MTSITPSPLLRLVFVLSFLAIASPGCAKQEDTKDTRLSRANDYFAADQYDKAEKEFREAVRLERSRALRQLGILYHDQGSFCGLSATQASCRTSARRTEVQQAAQPANAPPICRSTRCRSPGAG